MVSGLVVARAGEERRNEHGGIDEDGDEVKGWLAGGSLRKQGEMLKVYRELNGFSVEVLLLQLQMLLGSLMTKRAIF